jgi:hypothetical protein
LRRAMKPKAPRPARISGIPAGSGTGVVYVIDTEYAPELSLNTPSFSPRNRKAFAKFGTTKVPLVPTTKESPIAVIAAEVELQTPIIE